MVKLRYRILKDTDCLLQLFLVHQLCSLLIQNLALPNRTGLAEQGHHLFAFDALYFVLWSIRIPEFRLTSCRTLQSGLIGEVLQYWPIFLACDTVTFEPVSRLKHPLAILQWELCKGGSVVLSDCISRVYCSHRSQHQSVAIKVSGQGREASMVAEGRRLVDADTWRYVKLLGDSP